ncbi:hypothetical protein GW17_00054844 [Ensete ventricosum]|nr:hypothetical protein GW17_00054844 [Ensete ventricosum]
MCSNDVVGSSSRVHQRFAGKFVRSSLTSCRELTKSSPERCWEFVEGDRELAAGSPEGCRKFAEGNKHNRGHKGDAGIELETRSQVRSSRPRFSLRLVSGRLLLGTLPLFDMQPTQPCQLKKSSPSQLRAAAVATPICCLQVQQPGPQLRLLPASRLLHLAKGAVVTADSGFSDL